MPRSSPLVAARRWWKERTDAHRYVVSPTEAPSAPLARVLRQEGLVLEVAGRRAWILTAGTPIDAGALFLANYWPVAALVLERYAPAAVAGVAAVRLHLEAFSPPEELPAYQAANESEYALSLYPGFTLRLRPRELSVKALQVITAGDARIPVLTPASLLTTLDVGSIAAGLEPVSAWLKHLTVRTPDLEAAVEQNPRPVILQRLADLAAGLGNGPLGRQLDSMARRISARENSPYRTGVGTRIRIPEAARAAPPGSAAPWLDEQAMRLSRQEAEVQAITGREAARLPTLSWSRLRANAQQAKAYDAYHSTTIEGYRISRELSDAIVRGEGLPAGSADRETLAAAMAVQGYARAFNEVLERVRRKAAIGTSLILDLYEALFRPSIDAGITDSAALRGWRTVSVQLRGWRYVPPNPKKIPDLIAGLERFAARADLSPIARALIVHLEFVTIHPFMDGNGRLARLLMNYALLASGLPWITVRSDERVPFFRSVERAQVDGDTGPFIRFLWHLIRTSAADLERQMGRSTRRSGRN